MRKVVLYELLSLDGVAESPDRYVFDFDDVMYANLAAVLDTQDSVILGRAMFDDWGAYWPTASDEPFASFINRVPKHVATSSPLTLDWNGSRRIEGPLADAVAALKDQPGGDIGVHGSISVAQSLLAAGLVDELRLVITPVVAGAGRRLFAGEQLHRFELIKAVATPTGSILADYRAAG